jgi:hypothetical protein
MTSNSEIPVWSLDGDRSSTAIGDPLGAPDRAQKVFAGTERISVGSARRRTEAKRALTPPGSPVIVSKHNFQQGGGVTGGLRG